MRIASAPAPDSTATTLLHRLGYQCLELTGPFNGTKIYEIRRFGQHVWSSRDPDLFSDFALAQQFRAVQLIHGDRK